MDSIDIVDLQTERECLWHTKIVCQQSLELSHRHTGCFWGSKNHLRMGTMSWHHQTVPRGDTAGSFWHRLTSAKAWARKVQKLFEGFYWD